HISHLLFLPLTCRPPLPRLFPYTTLFRSGSALGTAAVQWLMFAVYAVLLVPRMRQQDVGYAPTTTRLRATAQVGSWLLVRSASLDRKSTRLNSSHVSISYAVFCLKKKNRQ